MTHAFRFGLLLTLLGAAPTGAAQDQAARSPGTVSLSRTAGVNELDGALWGAGDGYQVRFEPWGIEFRPALRSTTGIDDSLTLRLQSLGRASEASLAQTQTATPRIAAEDGKRIEYRRGLVTERYDVGVDGVEQSFVFHERPTGSGDLVVRFTIATELVIAADGNGLRFDRPGIGGFRLGGVTGIDARGARAAGTVRIVDDVLELALPAAFVDAAALPLTLDPLLGNVFRLSGVSTDTNPTAAYDATNNLYLVVWTAGPAVHGHRVSASGLPLGSRLILAATGRGPDVANIASRDVFVVVYGLDYASVEGRAVRAGNGTLVPGTFFIPGLPVFPSIGGSRTGSPASPGLALCVWTDTSGNLSTARACRVSVDPDNRPVFTLGAVQTLAQDSRRASVSRHDAGVGRYAVTYGRVLGGQQLVHARMLDGNGQALTAEQVISIASAPQTFPEIGGDGVNWVATWLESGSAKACGLRYSSRLGTLTPSTPVLTAGPSTERPSVTWTGQSCLLGFSSTSASVRALDLLGCTDCEGLFGPALGSGALSGSGAIEGSGPADEALLVGTDAQGITAQLFRAADGRVTPLPGGCGAGGIAHAPCARSPNAAFAHQLVGGLPSAPTIFVLAASESPLPCGTCSLVPDLRSAILLPMATSAAGEARLPVPIPASSPLRGVPLTEQWATINLVNPACATFQIDLSGALRVVIE